MEYLFKILMISIMLVIFEMTLCGDAKTSLNIFSFVLIVCFVLFLIKNLFYLVLLVMIILLAIIIKHFNNKEE